MARLRLRSKFGATVPWDSIDMAVSMLTPKAPRRGKRQRETRKESREVLFSRMKGVDTGFPTAVSGSPPWHCHESGRPGFLGVVFGAVRSDEKTRKLLT